jgi:glycosyltransferase involved in cell wall biosynthesis
MKNNNIRVAFFFPVVPNYRIPLLERFSKSSTIDFTCFHGVGREGYTVRSVGSKLPIKSIMVKNIFWPYTGRVAWQSGVLYILLNYDVVICHDGVHNISNWAIILFKWLHRKKVILFGLGYHPNETQSLINTMIYFGRRIVSRLCDAHIVYTVRGFNKTVQLGTKSQKIFVANNTLDVEYLMSLSKNINNDELYNLRESLNISKNKVLIFVGRLSTEKRVDVLIDAFGKLTDKLMNDVTLIIIGEGYEKSKLEKKAYGLNNIKFLGPIYELLVLAKYFMLSDLLVIPGRPGLTCVHGFCYGIPIITSRSGVQYSPELDYICHNRNGLIVQEPNSDHYSQSIYKLLTNYSLLSKLREGALNTAKSLSMGKMADEFIKAVEYVMKDSSHT